MTANGPIGAFGGHDCALIPYARSACDHLESQLTPIETWGRSYTTAPMGDPHEASVNVVRVVAALDGTEVTIDPPQGDISSFSIDAGQWQEFESDTPFRVTSTQGIMVTQFLRGQFASEPTASRGDPTMVILPPQAQFRSNYTFATPTSYSPRTEGQSYLLVVRPPGLAVTLDGTPLMATWAAVGDREIATVPVTSGTHRMDATASFGVVVFGMGRFTSYAYPAGLDLEEIQLI